jgi:hypothetical protein
MVTGNQIKHPFLGHPSIAAGRQGGKNQVYVLKYVTGLFSWTWASFWSQQRRWTLNVPLRLMDRPSGSWCGSCQDDALGVDNVGDGGFQLAQVEVLGALGVDDGGDGGFQLAQVEVLGEEASGALLGWRRYEIWLMCSSTFWPAFILKITGTWSHGVGSDYFIGLYAI